MQGSKPVDHYVVETMPGASHCGFQDSTFLVMGWPPGTAEQNWSTARWYVRNPSGPVTRDFLLAQFSSNVSPPSDARYTNFHNSAFELWLAPSDQDVAAYIKTGGHFERWPRSRHALMCS
jgi:hypothetical protein